MSGSDGLQSSADISTDLSFDNVGTEETKSRDTITDYKRVLLQLHKNEIDIYNILDGQMHGNKEMDSKCENEECDSIENEYLKFENIDFMKELLVNWTSLLQSGQVLLNNS